MEHEPDPVVERFRPTSGRITGAVSLALCLAVLVICLVDRESGWGPAVASGAALIGALIWAGVLRPALRLTERHLVLRNMVETVHLPLAAIEELAIRQTLAVRVGEKRFVSPAVGKSWRTMLKSRPGDPSTSVASVPDPSMPYADFVEQRIRRAMDDARAAAGITRYSDEQQALAAGVRRTPAWPEIALLAGSGAALLVSWFVL
ncbi:MAG: hypothetical protein F2667_02145 [Actinobacteria bacterium]|uniref:Unannotated protein n=1 Tax=freshwater metagenome TaxID=449393 RepID=A0A6J6NVU0_9ZZZZ|nr:hypothetical protein [Actinomycetota bacterium]